METPLHHHIGFFFPTETCTDLTTIDIKGVVLLDVRGLELERLPFDFSQSLAYPGVSVDSLIEDDLEYEVV